MPINTLWSLGLIIALIENAEGCGEWFHEYLARDNHDPKKQLKVQFYRDVGVRKWRVYEIAAFLPLLLQLALLLFFTGLYLFLHDLDPVVGWITTGLMLIWLALFLSMTAMPAFSAQCPYKTPMLKNASSSLRSLWVFIPESLLAIMWPTAQLIHDVPDLARHFHIPRWEQRLYSLAGVWKDAWGVYEEGEVSEEKSLDIPVVLCAKDILQGEKLTDTTLQCFPLTSLKLSACLTVLV